MKFNKDGFLFDDQNVIHYISDDDLNDLILLADEEIRWQEKVRYEVEHRNINNNVLLDEFRIRNTKGTIVPYPFGIRVLTFNSSRHLFRGENKIYKASIPSLNRKLNSLGGMSPKVYRAIANLRINRFINFLSNINVIPYWEYNICDVNYKALAQHYGFETHLLDLTNDFMVALFFATCKYDRETDSYLPLTLEDINKDENSKYGVIYHSPDWVLDYFEPMPSERYFLDNSFSEIDSGKHDGIAFQIGYQPLYRCDIQKGFIYPMRFDKPLQEDNHFEKLYFKQSVELSNRVYNLMDKGKKIFPDEGISMVRKYLDDIKRTMTFTLDDLKEVYDIDISKDEYASFNDYKNDLVKNGVNVVSSIDYDIPKDILLKINNSYDNRDYIKEFGGKIFYKREDVEYFKWKRKMLKNVLTNRK